MDLDLRDRRCATCSRRGSRRDGGRGPRRARDPAADPRRARVAPQVGPRLRRLGRLARPLCERPADAAPAPPALQALLDEARLFFDYLREDYRAALDSLERLEARTSSPDERLRLLSLRAQIFLGQGATDRAAETIAFLGDGPARVVDEAGDHPRRPLADGRGRPPPRLARLPSSRSEAWTRAGLEADRDPEAPMGLRNLDAPLPGLGLDPAESRY